MNKQTRKSNQLFSKQTSLDTHTHMSKQKHTKIKKFLDYKCVDVVCSRCFRCHTNYKNDRLYNKMRYLYQLSTE